MYRLLTFLIWVPCGLFSQGTFFINKSDARKPIISIDIQQGEGSAAKERVSSGDIKKELCLYMIKDGKRARVPVSTKYSVANRQISMTPVTKLGEGLEFEILKIDGTDTISQQYFTPRSTEVEQIENSIVDIFPLSDSVPKNILFYHVRFQHPMQPDKLAFENVNIYSPDGTKYERLWRERSYWIDDNKVLVLMVHPGRVKRGIDHDIPYEIGETVELKVDGEFTDVYGRLVKLSANKKFTIIKEDYDCPKIEGPGDLAYAAVTAGGSRNPLPINFSEKMDHSSVVDGVEVYDVGGNKIDVDIRYNSDSEFEFTPKELWKPGKYKLKFGKIISDFSANRINRPFELEKPEDIRLDKDIFWDFEIK